VAKDIGAHSQVDATLRYQPGLPKPAVPAYYEQEVNWMWTVWPNTEVSLIGQNLLHKSHVELGGPANRSVLLKLTQRF
jgi:iron complex outermembrane receptor protein